MLVPGVYSLHTCVSWDRSSTILFVRVAAIFWLGFFVKVGSSAFSFSFTVLVELIEVVLGLLLFLKETFSSFSVFVL